MPFKEEYTFADRYDECSKIMNKYPERIPCIVESKGIKNYNLLTKRKYLVPSDITIGHLIYVIRKRITLQQQDALYLFINNTLPSSTNLLKQIYTEHKDLDGFLYILVERENTFG